jgi:hypothetical protein
LILRVVAGSSAAGSALAFPKIVQRASFKPVNTRATSAGQTYLKRILRYNCSIRRFLRVYAVNADTLSHHSLIAKSRRGAQSAREGFVRSALPLPISTPRKGHYKENYDFPGGRGQQLSVFTALDALPSPAEDALRYTI